MNVGDASSLLAKTLIQVRRVRSQGAGVHRGNATSAGKPLYHGYDVLIEDPVVDGHNQVGSCMVHYFLNGDPL